MQYFLYLRDDRTAETWRGGWFHTGDMGRYDENSYLYTVDRGKDMIISGGENIYSTEIEYVILQLGGIAEVAVVAKPDEKWGEGCPTPLWFKPLTPIL